MCSLLVIPTPPWLLSGHRRARWRSIFCPADLTDNFGRLIQSCTDYAPMFAVKSNLGTSGALLRVHSFGFRLITFPSIIVDSVINGELTIVLVHLCGLGLCFGPCLLLLMSSLRLHQHKYAPHIADTWQWPLASGWLGLSAWFYSLENARNRNKHWNRIKNFYIRRQFTRRTPCCMNLRNDGYPWHQLLWEITVSSGGQGNVEK